MEIFSGVLVVLIFQSTLPAGGATGPLYIYLWSLCDFNPRSPRGERPRLKLCEEASDLFQSTLPAGGATYCHGPQVLNGFISIHAPRGGSDWVTSACSCKAAAFQSTLPAGGATGQNSRRCLSTSKFQSTLPAGGATIKINKRKGIKTIFQSTLPAGGATTRQSSTAG